jgi:hypothetical protein
MQGKGGWVVKFKYSCFIPGNVPSLKNSRICTKKGSFPSKTVTKYLRNIGVAKYSSSKQIVVNYKTKPNLFEKAVVPMKEIFVRMEPPYKIGLFFIRNSKRKFDWINAAQIICDLLTAHGVIHDDNMDYLVPTPVQVAGSWYTVDRERPGCIVYF